MLEIKAGTTYALTCGRELFKNVAFYDNVRHALVDVWCNNNIFISIFAFVLYDFYTEFNWNFSDDN